MTRVQGGKHETGWHDGMHIEPLSGRINGCIESRANEPLRFVTRMVNAMFKKYAKSGGKQKNTDVIILE